MNYFRTTIVALSCLLGFATVETALGQERWAGNYVTENQGYEGQLTLYQLGTRMAGVYTVDGEQFTVQGRIDGVTASGTVIDQNFDQAAFEARLHAAGLVVTLQVPDQSGRLVPVSLNFERAEVAARRQASGDAGTGGVGLVGGAGGGGAAGGGDQRIVGAWRATEAGSSGDFTWASDAFVQFRADGSCAEGGGQTYAGGAGSSIGSGRGAMSACQWRTDERVLYLRRAGGGWEAIARYAVHEDGSLMMWTYDDGSKRIWERQSR
jgi:hypothetical protein